MIRVGYFCTGGYTETGSIQTFLEKINPKLKFVRCFPVVNKPNLKLGRLSSTPIRSQNGVSGEALVRAIIETIQKPEFEKFDLILLIDDMDCRFRREGQLPYSDWVKSIGNQISTILGAEVPFDALFASPEVEAWFLADWSNSFSKEYRSVRDELRYKIATSNIGYFLQSNIEDYGGCFKDGSCAEKLSDKIIELVASLGTGLNSFTYSKKVQGVAMLSKIDPNEVAVRCRLFFAPIYRKLAQI